MVWCFSKLNIYTCIYIYDNSVLFFLHNCPLLIPLHNTAVLNKICRFLINDVKFTQTLTKLDLPTLRKGSTEERTQRNKWKIWHSLGLEPRYNIVDSRTTYFNENCCIIYYIYIYVCMWVCFTKLSTNECFHYLVYIVKSSFKCYVYIYTYMYIYIYNSLFFLHNCPLLIPLHNTAVLIIICRFWINVVKFMQTLTKLDLPTLRKGST